MTNFTYLPDKILPAFLNTYVQGNLMKWSLKGNYRIQYYNFDREFDKYNLEDFIKSFFRNPSVYSSLQVLSDFKWKVLDSPPERIKIKQIPCTVTSMNFFDKLCNPENRIVRNDNKTIIQCLEELVDDFYISDNLRGMLLDETNNCYNLYSPTEREEFIFKIFKLLCLGGEWSQFEDTVQPYIEMTKIIYKDLLSVQMSENNRNVMIRSHIYSVAAYGNENISVYPGRDFHQQNVAFLIIDSFKRQLAAFIHQFGRLCES